jgi:hypothetical protein
MTLAVRDAGGREVPPGAVGELWVSGAGVALGYHGRPDLTAERFETEDGVRSYRTGDLVRFGCDGVLHYLGRRDRQIKLRGFRVEPGEIEAALRGLPGVEDAAVLAEPDRRGALRLQAHVAGATLEGLREALAGVLPDHMVPTHWALHAALPITPNGKLDRAALSAHGAEPVGQSVHTAPNTLAERALAPIWARVLGVERVGAEDDFFALGGHSLLAARLVHEVNAVLGVRFTLTDLLAAPRLSEMAAGLGPVETLSEVGTDLIRHDPAARHDPFPLTDIQEAYWVGRSADMGLGGVGAHAYDELAVTGLDPTRLEEALNRLIARHDMLRVVFAARESGTRCS